MNTRDATTLMASPPREEPEDGLPFYVSSQDSPAKAQILRVALRLFVRDGLCETSIRAIAAETGYTNPALFKHFKGKEELALYLFERCYLHLAQAVARSIDPHRSFAANLAAVVAGYADMLYRDLDAVLYVQENLRHFWPMAEERVQRQSILGLLHELLEQGRRASCVTAEIDSAVLATAWAGLMGQFARARYFGEFPGSAQDWAIALEKLLLRMTHP